MGEYVPINLFFIFMFPFKALSVIFIRSTYSKLFSLFYVTGVNAD